MEFFYASHNSDFYVSYLIVCLFRAPRDELKQLIQSGGGLVSQQARLAQV